MILSGEIITLLRDEIAELKIIVPTVGGTDWTMTLASIWENAH